jgi:hypothetical protein
MTDDLTKPIETPPTTEQAPGAPAPEPSDPSTAAAPEPAGTQPVVTAGAPGSNRVRWAIGLGVAAIAVVVAIGAMLVLGSRPSPEALKYIPADAAVVVEVRMDLPGDQLQKLGNFLAKFPGFLDQATLPAKLDESLNRLVGNATGGGVSYVTDLKPWLSGPAFAAVWAPAGQAAEPDRVLLSTTTTGSVDCNRPFQGQSVTHESYAGRDLFLGVTGSDKKAAACVLDGRQALVGDLTSVKAALDAKGGGSGMDRSQAYAAARAALEGDQLTTIYVNGESYSRFLSNPGAGGAVTPPIAAMPDISALTGPVPSWAIVGVRAEDDTLVIDSVAGPALDPGPGATPGPSLLPLPATHASVIAPLAPANTIFYFETQGVGVGLQNVITRLRTIPDLATAFQMLDGAGGAGQLVGWVEDAGIIVVNGPGQPTGGLALTAADDAAAAQRVSTLTGLIAFAGLGSNGVQTRESTIAGVKVTTITISNLGALVPPGQLPPGVDVPADAKVEFSIAAKGRVILLGTGENFMTAVLNTQAGSALADQAGYKQATARALPSSRTTLYVGVRDVAGLIESFLPEGQKATWDTEVKPYVAPFQALSMTSASEGTGSRQRVTITVSKP